jgi:hypothetical protein
MKIYGDMDIQLNTHEFLAAVLDFICHHNINHKWVLDRNKFPLYDFNEKRLFQTEDPVISTGNFPYGRVRSSSDTMQCSEQVKYRKPGPLGV